MVFGCRGKCLQSDYCSEEWNRKPVSPMLCVRFDFGFAECSGCSF